MIKTRKRLANQTIDMIKRTASHVPLVIASFDWPTFISGFSDRALQEPCIFSGHSVCKCKLQPYLGACFSCVVIAGATVYMVSAGRCDGMFAPTNPRK